MTKHYDEAIGIAICQRLIEGQTIKEICKDPDLPSERTVYRWLAAERTFWQLYARAREAQMDKWSDDVVEIADEIAAATVTRVDRDGKEIEVVTDPTAVQAAKLRIDTRKFLMSKLAATTYGDKVDVNLSGAVEVSALSDEELEARTRARLVALGVEVAGPLLLALPGAVRAPAPAVTPAPEPIEVVEPDRWESTRGPRSARKKSANDLLGLVF